jgi:predicted hydrocarbon binding protein
MRLTGPVSFFVMSGEALKSLGDELQILAGEEHAREAMDRYGFRCGEGMALRLGMGVVTVEQLKDLLPDLLLEAGLGRGGAGEVSVERIVISFEESLEAGGTGKSTEPVCHFTSGYLAGLISTLLDRRFQGDEECCRAMGDTTCTHVFAPSAADFRPASESAVGGEIQNELEVGTGYLVKEENAEKSYDIFSEHAKHGYQGLCITRDFPAKIRKKYGLEKTPIIWLSTAETSEVTIAPQNLSALYYQMENFLKKTEKGVILLSGMEYLISQNSYQSVLKFVQLLNELIAVRSAILVVSLSPLTLEERDLKTLERELTRYEPKKKVVDVGID